MAEGTVIPVTVGVLEILVDGVVASIWVALLVAGLAHWKQPPPWLSDGPTTIAVYAFVAYALGVIVDGAADGMFIGLQTRAWKKVPASQEPGAIQEPSAQSNDHRPGLAWAVTLALAPRHDQRQPDSSDLNAGSELKRPKAPKRPLPPDEFRRYRHAALRRDDGLAKFMEYQRSRQRIARAMTLNLLLLLPVGIWFLAGTAGAHPIVIATFAIAVVLGIWASGRAAERLRESYEAHLRQSYEDQVKLPKPNA